MIHGLVKPSLAQAGKIKIGGLGREMTSRKGNKFRPPEKFDHFVITTQLRQNPRDQKSDLITDEVMMAALTKDHDGKCRAIPIILHSDEIEEVFPTDLAAYAGKSLACKGDGKKATRWTFSNGTRTDQTKECVCPCPYLEQKKCKPHGRLYCSINLPGQAIAGAVHVWRTTSIISIQQMTASLEQIKSMVGSLRGVPLVLRVLPVQVTPEGKSTTVYVCHVELRASDLLEVQQRVLQRREMERQLNGSAPRLHLPSLADESPEEMADTADEFYPPEDEQDEVQDAEYAEREPGDDDPDFVPAHALLGKLKNVEEKLAATFNGTVKEGVPG
jgi:hypothetical protein